MKKIYGGMMLSAFALTMAMAITPVSASAAEGVQINEENFPDSTFRIYVSEMYDRDGNGTLNTEEIDAATKCSVANFEISDLKGLQFFTALTELDCSGNKLTSLDVSKNTALTKLECSGNQLFSLDVNNNTALTRLDCSYTRLVSLDISQNTALTYLQCNNNQLTSLDISNNTALTDLQCSWNRIASLDTSKNRNLTFLECTSNYNLTSLDISQNTALTELICNKNKLTSLDTSKNTALKYLSCDTNQLTSLDVSKNTALKALSCNSNQLTSLDVSNNSALVYIICEKNQLSFLDLSKNTELVNLFCSKNKLTSLDLSNTKVSTFYCSPNVSTIIMDNNRTFDLSILPGFDVSKASNWTGGTVSGSFLTVNSDAAEVTCTYDCGRNYSGTFTFNITNEPIITNHPTDVSVPIGSKASVSIAATDSGQKYTWYYKDVDSSSFSKSSNTSSTYSATMCAALNGRQVYCVIAYQNGDLFISNPVTLRSKVNIIKYPANVLVPIGSTASASVTATGNGLKYTWYYKDVNSSSFLKSANTASTYSAKMSAALDGRQLYCVITDQNGNSVSTNTVTLKSTVKIIKQPANVSAAIGSTASAAVTATGNGLSYTWYYSDNNGSSFLKSSNRTSTYSAKMSNALNGRQVYCVIKDQNGYYTISNTVTLNSKVKITRQPVNSTSAIGSTASASVSATGSGLKYTWYYKDVNSSSFLRSSNKTSTYSAKMSNALNGRQLYCVITDQNGNSVTSNTVTLKKK